MRKEFAQPRFFADVYETQSHLALRKIIVAYRPSSIDSSCEFIRNPQGFNGDSTWMYQSTQNVIRSGNVGIFAAPSIIAVTIDLCQRMDRLCLLRSLDSFLFFKQKLNKNGTIDIDNFIPHEDIIPNSRKKSKVLGPAANHNKLASLMITEHFSHNITLNIIERGVKHSSEVRTGKISMASRTDPLPRDEIRLGQCSTQRNDSLGIVEHRASTHGAEEVVPNTY
ncbi:hypothetical protein WA026_000011 [Henosepilachna vigintioctopunctata]|uniref:Uncharacterized protein n=1 Tax=Henosepilachna vigintioctopunctata TaxID=420089 RepID=A0AAW1UX38_9CUCU